MRVRPCLSYVYHDKHSDRSLQEKANNFDIKDENYSLILLKEKKHLISIWQQFCLHSKRYFRTSMLTHLLFTYIWGFI